MNTIISYYNQFDEWGRLDREPIEFQVNWHFIKKYLPTSGEVLDNGAGPGKYSIKLAQDGYQMTLSDLTPSLVDKAKQKAEEFQLLNNFSGFHSLDARWLEPLKSETFDASLMLGPMYHLQEESDRKAAISELHRVTKKNGLVFVAFMPRIKHIFNSLMRPDVWPPNNEMDVINHFAETGVFNHQDEGRFTGAYYFNIDEIEPFMEENGFETLELIGSNIASILTQDELNYWKEKGEYDKLIQLLIEQAGNPYTLGVSSHLLYIGRKK
ncbi:class I SAM-dependent methyltransferase [Falsibacillus pallidus]|uniref:Methyltransferase family protein n=1 Tax=Falsibacillus pallidus TaxID=493781 RepID=A0A370G0D4_9BACI|nr:class I SAM-dependent methyltransferase [Falsibacillus pallidus]RDI36680.1 methyltransferase family protein [Falsibacillus pallidus]